MSLFTTVISKVPKRNAFNLSFENLSSMEFGEIVPLSCKEVLPNDTFRQSTEVVVKTAPMLAPVYSRIDLYLHYFFVPLRLLQTDFEDFITTGVDGLSLNLTPPFSKLIDVVQSNHTAYDTTGVGNGSLGDYLNLPKITDAQVTSRQIGDMPVNMLPFLAYQKIYSDWFKDELLDSFEFEPVAGGELSAANRAMACRKRFRSWKKDYFTSARPNTQLGASIPIPLKGDILGSSDLRFSVGASDLTTNRFIALDGNSRRQDVDRYSYKLQPVASGNTSSSIPQIIGNDSYNLRYSEGLSLAGAGINVNDLRRALKLQEWQERNMRGGNRYIENILHHFGVKSSDARLQRSEFLGGKKIPIVISEVTQTSSTDNQPTALGQLAGKGGTVGRSNYVKWHSEEHGFLICLASIMPKAAYMQGLPRMFWRMSYLDYPWPLFGNLGEQEVFNGELYLDQAKPGDTFGYQSRYAEMKFSNSEIHGSFRDSQAFWHNARIFQNTPNLNNSFVQLSNPSDQNRIFPTLDSGFGHFYVHAYHDIKAIRALPKYGIPSI